MFHRLTSMTTCLYLLCLSSATTQWKQYQACHFLWCCFSEKQLYQPLRNPPWAKPIPSIDIYVSSIEIKNPLAHGISSCFKSRKCIVILKKKKEETFLPSPSWVNIASHPCFRVSVVINIIIIRNSLNLVSYQIAF